MKLKIKKVKSIYVKCPETKSLLIATAWTNHKGFDLTIYGSEGEIQQILITYPELNIIKDSIKVLDIENNPSIIVKCPYWKSLVTISMWDNKEGFNLHIQSAKLFIQHIRMTFNEFNIIKKAAKRLNK
jgi:hypothetical protein